MEAFPGPHIRGRGRGFVPPDSRRGHSHNRQWVANGSERSPPVPGSEPERRERGGHRGGRGGRGAVIRGHRQFPNQSLRITNGLSANAVTLQTKPEDETLPLIVEPELETQEERDKLYREVSGI